MDTTYEEHDIDRFKRKISKLLTQHNGKNLMCILREKTKIQYELRSILELSNEDIERYIDKALDA